MNAAIILSGGTGSRLGGVIPKQYLRVNGRMLITHATRNLIGHEGIAAIYIVAADDFQTSILSDFEQAGYCMNKIKGFAHPGQTRQISIYNGLQEMARTGSGNIQNVLIHDAARPNLTASMVSACLEALQHHEGVMPVLTMKDTVYESADGQRISRLLPRERLFAGQAPEGFRFDTYYLANQALFPDRIYHIHGSSEPAVLAGMDVIMIPGEEENYKITTGEDLERLQR